MPGNRIRRRQASTRSRTAVALSRVCLRSEKATLSKTLIESNSAPSWKAMPHLRRSSVCSCEERLQKSTPSTSNFPESGRIRPIKCLSITLLPMPEGPITTTDWRSGTSKVR
jgi:hypothetical protein